MSERDAARVQANLPPADASPDATLARIGAILDGAGVPYTIRSTDLDARRLVLVIDPSRDTLFDLVAALDDARYHAARVRVKDAIVARSTIHAVDLETAWRIDLVIRPLATAW